MEISDSATKLFGATSATDVFASNVSVGPTAEQLSAKAIVTAQTREINRIRGYKLTLTPAENLRLSEIQAEILVIQEKASAGTVREDELEDRIDLYEEADIVLGKPILEIDTETDEAYIDFISALETLLLPDLSVVAQSRVDSFKNIQEGLAERIEDSPDNGVLLAQYTNISNAIDRLQPLKSISELTTEERAVYDETVEALNDYVGVELQLSSDDAIRVRKLEESIQTLQSSLPSTSVGPSTVAVNRALARFA